MSTTPQWEINFDKRFGTEGMLSSCNLVNVMEVKHFISLALQQERERITRDEELWEHLRNPNCLAAKLRLEIILDQPKKE